eukprot:superscaffoldBa00001550_g11043
MSFVRIGRPQQHTKGKRPVRSKKAAAPKREWVSTVNDLSVHKLTAAELSHRHEIHKSHNKAAAQWELRERALKSRLRHAGSPAPLDQASLSIIREVFSDQLLLQDVLARSDRAMAVVKDLFGDAPRRQTVVYSMFVSTGHPSVTMAPNCDFDSALPVLQRPDPPTQLSLLSQSMMDQQATLNATVAVQRVRSRQSQSEEAKEEPSVMVSQVLNPELPLNNSGRISSRTTRTRRCVSKSSELDASSIASLSGDQSSLGLLQTMLGQVEADLDSLSPETVAESAQSPKQHRKQGLTGFSREEEVQNETLERRRLEEKLREQRGLIDALTAETMTLREEAAAMQAELQQRTAELEQKLDTVVLAMGGLGQMGGHIYPPQESDIKAAVCQSAPVPERTQASVPPAVLLSPPQQRDNWQQIPVTHPVPLHQELPAVDILHSCKDLKIHSSASSLTSLPLTSLPSTSSLSLTSDPFSSQLSPEVMLAEIAQLSRQNELIRAQLSQAKSVGSGTGGSPNSSSGEQRQRSSSCSSSGRVTPQSVGERRISASRSTERRSLHIQAAEGEQQTNEVTAYDTLSVSSVTSVSSVQQRLLELNRQSAAARGRLLELIEQQKQSVSAKVSPSVSPVPPSSFSPHTAAGGGSPEVSVLMPSQQPLFKAGGAERRSAGSEASSSPSFRGEASDGNTQVEKRREREGWFALSAHVR